MTDGVYPVIRFVTVDRKRKKVDVTICPACMAINELNKHYGDIVRCK